VRILAAHAAAIALLLAAGCGDEGPTPEEEVRSAVAAFGRATAAKDYQALCDRILSSTLIEQVREIGLPCEVALRQGLGEVQDPQLTIGRVRVDGERATVEVRTSAAGEEPSRDTVELVNEDGTWKIASLGSS
jgi:4-aminobutyrate aminotransferase-like enzyme